MKNTKKILVVDDSEVNLFLIRTIFDDAPEIQVEMESNSTIALSRMREGKPDVLILDLMMPYVDGFKLLEEIQKDSAICHIPVVVLSARYDLEAINLVKKYRVVEYLKKPIQVDLLKKCVQEALFESAKKEVKP